MARGGGQVAHPTPGADGDGGFGVVGVVPPTPTPPHEGEGGPVVGGAAWCAMNAHPTGGAQ